ncbi:class I adenylate-forming enzyme family protein [Mycolicibacterium confluentis]|uniref:Acyl-CoA synthetase n=1 Tax=Mycolicibacterium confluentis TaxID=28047 RepID=A0A7I7XTC3_9MYCO|nr:class I adenylate-forming enzyme family protein [Mycolicibacterium confluentis]MCV7319414.1 acyl--CoA ligase [Mycolicibacterium confluentis]ORV24380.1 AMP-dependent synthetase [Mycolicibacterium confluentis]BBZ32495.1 acyl-CoA synthetase [Mycolicibacterium confluentis]
MPDPVVLAFEGRDYRRSELDAEIASFAAVLAQRGVRPGQRVALMSSNRPEFVVALYAVWRLGASVVLISTAWKRAEVAHALALTEPAHAIGDQATLAELMPMVSLDEERAAAPAPAAVTPDADAESVLVFSSGTTGLPKAVRHTYGSFAAAISAWRTALQLTASDRMQIVTPPSHILGLLNIATVLESGGWLRLHRRFDIDTMLRHIETDRITVEMAVAPIALAIASHPALEAFDLSSLRYIMWCATPVTVSVAETVTRRTGVGWTTAYGASELPVLTCNELSGGPLDTVGRAADGVRLRVVSLEAGEPLPTGEPGEIQAQSNSMMAGYLPAEDTATVVVDGWYRTGDVGFLDDDGHLRITDRAKEMIKVRGFQVAPAEVEAVLHGHPDVSDCAVFGVPHEADGEAVVAAVAVHREVPAAELVALVGESLASYKRPAEIVFVPEIPRLPSGKVLRRVLKERHGCTSDH